MLQLDQAALADIAAQVIAQLGNASGPNPTTLPGGAKAVAAPTPAQPAPASAPAPAEAAPAKSCGCTAKSSGDGVFSCVEGAAEAARDAFEQLERGGFELREKVCRIVKHLATSNAEAWGQFEFAETKIGRLEHKAEKLKLVAKVPGVEWLRRPGAMAGDLGLTMEVQAPFGVVAAILPVTHSVPTLSGNVVNIIAAGNAVVFNPHPGGAKSAAMAVRAFNEAIRAETGVANLICTIEEPTLESFQGLCASSGIDLLAITGGPAVVAAAMKSGKRAICAGPGNPPVIVDETADLAKAAREVMAGASFDNNLLCIGEKQAFVTAGAWDGFIEALKREGGQQVSGAALAKLTSEAFTDSKDAGGCSHPVLNRALVGADASKLAALAGANVPAGTPLLFAEADADNLFVLEEQMMPMLPVVRCANFEEALEGAKKSEHGYKHSAIIHSSSLERISAAARYLNTTVFIANGPSTAGLGLDAEGYLSYSIATTTGEGITTPATFTRTRRVTLAGGLKVMGA